MQIRRRRPLKLLLSIFTLYFLVPAICPGQGVAPVIEVPNPPNSAAQQSKHYVVLVSLDGFRYDYAAKYGAKNIREMAVKGASAPEGMIPAYPSLTFPNHYTIVTGLYPEHHGIVANSFYDPERKARYSYSDPASATDGSWYGGTPLWVLAEQQGMRAACFFWPGSEAEIQGKRPSYYLKFDNKFPDDQRVAQVLAWLRLPEAGRPHFVTLYFASVDSAGHAFGPDAPETAGAVRHVDDMIGKLSAGIAATHLPVDLIVISDHGMETVKGGWVLLDKLADLSNVETSGSLLYAKSEQAAERLFAQLRAASIDFKAYRRVNMPQRLHYDSNPREGDPVIVPTGPYLITAHDPNANGPARELPKGFHGYDPKTMPAMKAIFYAEGPDIRGGATVPSFENVDVYPFIAQILGLRAGHIDGKLRALQPILLQHSLN